MHETKQQITQRKIRNGLRKQAEKVQYEKEKCWRILKEDTALPKIKRGQQFFGVTDKYGYSVLSPHIGVINWNTTA